MNLTFKKKIQKRAQVINLRSTGDVYQKSDHTIAINYIFVILFKGDHVQYKTWMLPSEYLVALPNHTDE